MLVKDLGIIQRNEECPPEELTKHLERVRNEETHDMYSEVNKSTGRVLCVCLTCGIQWESE